ILTILFAGLFQSPVNFDVDMVGNFVPIAKALVLFDIEIVHLFEKLFALKSSHGHQDASGRLMKQLKMTSMSKSALFCFVVVVSLFPRILHGQGRLPGFEGTWRGTLTSFSDLPLLLILEKSGDRYVGKVIDVDKGNIAPATSVRVN